MNEGAQVGRKTNGSDPFSGPKKVVSGLMFRHFFIAFSPLQGRCSASYGIIGISHLPAISHSKEILGHAGFLYNHDEGLYEIVGVAVKKGFQGKGIGRALIETICAKVSDLGEQYIILFTLDHPGMEPTLAFYSCNGFECAGHEKDYFAPGYHRVKFRQSFNQNRKV